VSTGYADRITRENFAPKDDNPRTSTHFFDQKLRHDVPLRDALVTDHPAVDNEKNFRLPSTHARKT
jgi:hypothetical protein